MSKISRIRLTLAISCAVLVFPADAWAQDAGTQQAQSAHEASVDQSASGDIIVTATRRSESLQSVPVAISAFSQEKLDAQGVRDVQDLSRIAPGLTFRNGGATSQISIRGISSGIGAGTTGIYIDDTPIQVRSLGQSSAATNAYPRVFDLERIEVLRGPQGTLFGAGSQGGTVRFITPEPSLTRFSGYARGELGFTEGGDPSHELGGAVGGPIVADQVGFRVSAYHRWDGGFVDRVDPVTGRSREKNADAFETIALRGALKFALGDKLTITPSVYYQKLNRKGDIGRLWQNLSDVDKGVFQNGYSQRAPGADRFTVYSLAAEYDLGFATVFSNTSFFNRVNRSTVDYTEVVPQALGKDYRFGQQYQAFAVSRNVTGQHSFTQEVRLQSNGDGRFRWVLGAFYQNNRQIADQAVPQANADALYTAIYGAGVQAVFGVPLTPPEGLIYFGSDRATDKQLAGFAQVDFDLIPAVTITAGVRVADTRFSSSNMQGGPFNGGDSAQTSEQSETPITPKFGINYKPSEDFLVYASAAKGFRVGGGNSPVPVATCGQDLASIGLTNAPPSYQSDAVWSYEGGVKGSFADRKVQFASSVFYIDWSNIQSPVSLPTCGFTFIGNLGSATSKGFDLQLTVKPVTGLTLDAAVGYTNARYNETISVSAGTSRSVLISKGERLDAAPWTVTLSGEYESSLPFRGSLSGYIRGDYSYTSAYNISNPANFDYDPLLERRFATNLTRLRVGARTPNLDLSAYVNNVFNSRDLLFRNRISVRDQLFTERVLRPREIGITASYRF